MTRHFADPRQLVRSWYVVARSKEIKTDRPKTITVLGRRRSQGRVSPRYFRQLCALVQDTHEHWPPVVPPLILGPRARVLTVLTGANEVLVRRRETSFPPAVVRIVFNEFWEIYKNLEWKPASEKEDHSEGYRFPHGVD